ncbi:hypothetical protein ACRDU6_10095 [Mycolicibacterium sp. ELW1]|uniref:hypothetical protein n=1 Tax=Mycobacteriaceae TaxID=1762 RepID=UPI0011ECE480|nr:hypothetical protein [Mycobacterium sp. ELW1]QEN12973.1 hypothetical protein D3H54_06650 [Mycobacterium sp. ELW1]
MSEIKKPEASSTVSDDRVREALRGGLALSALSEDEGALLNSAIDTAIQDRLADGNYGTALAARGITTVALVDDGRLIEYRTDGTTHLVSSL